MHGLIFNLNTKYCYSHITCYGTYTRLYVARGNPAPCFPLSHFFPICQSPLRCPLFTYLENQLSWSWREYPSTLFPHLPSTVQPVSHPDTPHRSSYNIYIDDINNISRPIWYMYMLYSMSIYTYVYCTYGVCLLNTRKNKITKKQL